MQFMEYADEDRSVYKSPDEVAAAAMHAMFSDSPKRRYMTVPNEGEARRTIGSRLSSEMTELNDWQAYSFSRDELIEMLDDAMAN